MKRKKWQCPLCLVTNLGGLRPRKDDIIRYCLPCSAKTGKLVLRICPADQTKKARKAAAAKARKEAAPKKARKTKKSWMRSEKYCYPKRANISIYNVAEYMCKASGWKNPYRLQTLWSRTIEFKTGKRNEQGAIRITIPRKKITSGSGKGEYCYSSYSSSGRASWRYGVTVKCGACIGDAIVTLLHELCHVDQDNYDYVNGKRRPHDLAFNMKQFEMAQKWWGYNTHPEDAGWSIGRGYAPTRHLVEWLTDKIFEKDQKIWAWLKKHSVKID
jgi:hypothetical protein